MTSLIGDIHVYKSHGLIVPVLTLTSSNRRGFTSMMGMVNTIPNINTTRTHQAEESRSFAMHRLYRTVGESRLLLPSIRRPS